MVADLNEGISQDTGSDISNNINADYGGDMASDSGIDLNAEISEKNLNKNGKKFLAGAAAFTAAITGTLAPIRFSESDIPNESPTITSYTDYRPSTGEIADEMISNMNDGFSQVASDIQNRNEMERGMEASIAAENARIETGSRDIDNDEKT
jgi:hypothetical protein